MSLTKTPSLCCRNCKTSFDDSLPSLPPTPVPYFFHKESCDLVLTSKDVSDIRKAIHSASSGRDLITERICQLEDTMNRWKSLRENHDYYILNHKEILSSARRLPEVVWVEIFKFASERPPLPSWDGDWDFQQVFLSGTLRSAPLNISHVNRHWRYITRSTPSLWARIDFYIKQSFPSSKIQLLRTFLGRSQNLPLCIRVHLSRDTSWKHLSQQVQENVKALVAMLSVHAERWQSVDLRLYSEIYDNLGRFPIEEAPRLSTLFLGTQDCRQDNSWYPDFVTHAPLLSTFRCDNFLPAMTGFKSMIPWSNLSSVEFGLFRNNTWGFSTSHIVHVLVTCPKLETFVMFGAFAEDEMPNLCHNSLKDLTLCSSQGTILAKLELPQLLCLSLDQVRRLDTKAASEFFSRSPYLKVLRLHHTEQISFLDFLPKDCNIEELEIILNDINELVYNLPTTFQSLASLWPGHFPHLRSIDMTLNFFIGQKDDQAIGVRLVEVIHGIATRFIHLERFRVEVVRQSMHPIAVDHFITLRDLHIPNLDITLV